MDARRRNLAVNGVIADFGTETVRTASGHPVALRPQAFAVLRYLAEHAGRLVTKDELMQALWSGLAVTDDSLVQCIHEIRHALRDSDRSVLKTAPKRGYRLVLPTAAAGQTGSDVASAAEGGLLPDRGKLSIAVLPFVNLSSDREQDHVADGITEDVITDLSRWQSIAVAARNSVFRFKGRPVDIRAAARELGARFVLEGSVRRLGERVRITAQLIDAETGSHVWAERYDRPTHDLFALQDDVVQTIVGTLVGRVYVSAAEHLRRRPPAHPAPCDLVLRANALAWEQASGRAEAKRCLEQAIDLDPGYGLPHSLLAMLLNMDCGCEFADSPEHHERAFALAKRGVELSDGESTSHVALGFLQMKRRSFDAALGHMQRAIAINPANPTHKADLGEVLSRIGRAEDALAQFRDARRMDPYFGPSWYWPALGSVKFMLHRYTEALADFDRGAPLSARSSAIMAGCCAKLGLVERAHGLVAQCQAIHPDATVESFVTSTVFKEAADRQHLAECLRLAGMPA